MSTKNGTPVILGRWYRDTEGYEGIATAARKDVLLEPTQVRLWSPRCSEAIREKWVDESQLEAL